jgi:hypothetical protein
VTGRPLLRFFIPAAFTGPRCAVRGGRPPDDPASAFHLRLNDPRIRGPYREPASPLRFFALRVRGGAARWCGGAGCCLAFVRRVAHVRRLNVALQSTTSLTTRAPDRSLQAKSIALTSDPSPQAPPLRPSAALERHAPPPFFARCSATLARALAAWPWRWSFPLAPRPRSWDSIPSQVCSRGG